MVDAVSVPGETNPQLPYFGLCMRMRRDANESSAKERRGKIRMSVGKQNFISVRRVMVFYWYRFRGHTTGKLPYDNKTINRYRRRSYPRQLSSVHDSELHRAGKGHKQRS